MEGLRTDMDVVVGVMLHGGTAEAQVIVELSMEILGMRADKDDV